MNKNSVLIISSEYDRSTFDVSKWLKHFGYECIYVNNLSSVVINIDNVSDNIVFTTSDKKYNLSMFNSIWYRRGEFKINSLNNSNKLFETYISFEDYVINKFIGCKIRQQKTLNNYEDNFINKLQLLERASFLNLKIPKTIICSSKEEVADYFKVNQKVITKSISEVRRENNIAKISYGSGTILLDNIEFLPDLFSPSLFQEYIEKKFEIRVFYLEGKFYPMAIFSQENELTAIDYRNYDLERPNRCVPFNLPEDIEIKLELLMKSIDINCGSIDLIYSKFDEFIFLEVNPIGQFQWVSRNCNYYIEMEIAKYLTSHNE